MAGHIGKAIVHPDGSMRADEPFHGGILSGSFNPLHEGHAAMVKTASDMLGKPVVYELSVANADKPPLEVGEVRRRVAQFAGAAPIVLTGVPVFYKKAELLPGCTFIIGVDTAVLIKAVRQEVLRQQRDRNAARPSANARAALRFLGRRTCRWRHIPHARRCQHSGRIRAHVYRDTGIGVSQRHILHRNQSGWRIR